MSKASAQNMAEKSDNKVENSSEENITENISSEEQKMEESTEIPINKTTSDNEKESAESNQKSEDGESDTPDEQKEETKEEMEERFKGQLAEKEDKYVRLLAEFENFKRRSTQEMQSRFKFASQSLSLSIITGLDNLERAIDQAKGDSDNEQLQEFVTGVEMVKQQFHDAFEKNNIERIFPKGEVFDPNKHEAMGVIETDEIQPDHVAEVFQAGYLLHDRVIRPAMVQVAKKKQS